MPSETPDYVVFEQRLKLPKGKSYRDLHEIRERREFSPENSDPEFKDLRYHRIIELEASLSTVFRPPAL